MCLVPSFLTGGWREQCFNVSIQTVSPVAVGRAAPSILMRFVVYLWLNLSNYGANEVLNDVTRAAGLFYPIRMNIYVVNTVQGASSGVHSILLTYILGAPHSAQ